MEMPPNKTRTPITTRRGDKGYTSLWGGDEVPKYDPRPEAYGTIDEASAVLGQARVVTQHERVRKEILRLQNDLFRMMAELAAGEAKTGEITVTDEQVADIEARMESIRNATALPEMFVISATLNSATLDVARTIIRRAERVVARMVHEGIIDNGALLRYLNRASDMAFLLARFEEELDGVPYLTIGAEDLE
ncbi:MAG TPA: cob(I)yrinic acid a,c-diamide adenosyltransferase [Candidatus Dormibacteraeota bacterium]|jgi:cob(I)alamin adenosyltransferase|nr:cob(I)yrinic acid a,c-diamide adenosyltransferase [Candidatus Dormibacteraeota bacterium]